MGFFARLLGTGAAAPIEAIGSAFDKLFTSDEEKLDKQALLARIAQQPQLLQAEINRIEAAHRSLFVAGWRPFIGWVCGLGFLWAFLGHPVFEWVVAARGLDLAAPAIATDNMMELVLALLGLGGLRTVEKLQGRAK
ncbi:MAG: holin family protein [Sphingomonadales bacterium]|nr:holin family protein [Sphingomonadales bacterium]